MSTAVAQPSSLQWSGALVAALLLHAGLALAFHQVLDGGAAGTGRAGIEIGLGPAGGAPGEAVGVAGPPQSAEVQGAAAEEAAPVVPEEAAVSSSAPPEAAAPGPETAPAVPPQQTAAAPAEAAVAPAALPQAVPLYAPKEAATPPPLPRAKPQPPVAKLPEAPAEAALAEPQVAEAVSEAVTAGVPGEAAQASGKTVVAALPGSGGKAGTDGGTASGASQSRSGGGRPGAYVDDAARLNAWLEQHKEYPRRAQLRRQVGEATLYFMIDRSGRVLDFRVEKSTGHRILDEEVVNMLKRASPVPPPPDSVSGATLEYRIPIGFDPPR